MFRAAPVFAVALSKDHRRPGGDDYKAFSAHDFGIASGQRARHGSQDAPGSL
jgi:hypothetical protein